MERLPQETYNQITSYLTFREKQTMALVCRSSHSMLRNGNLYKNVSIRGPDKFNEAAVFFKQNESYRSKLKKLCLFWTDTSLEFILTIPVYFGSLQSFVWDNYGNDDYQKNELNTITKEILQGWKRLRSFEEINRYPLSTQILKHGGFCNLTKLAVNLHFSNTSCTLLVNQFSKAPQLKHLELSHAQMSLLDLEQLHCNAPQLETLYLMCIIQIECQEEQQSIGVAEHLVDLRLCYMKASRNSCAVLRCWMAYIAIKYKKLRHLTIDGHMMCRGAHHYYEAKLLEIFAACLCLESYHVRVFPVTSRMLRVADQNNIRLKRITLLVQPDLTAASQLDNLLASHQIHSIETFYMFAKGFEPAVLFDVFQEFSNLVHLEFENTSSSQPIVHLDIVLDTLIHLETLKLAKCKIALFTNKEYTTGHLETKKLQCLILHKITIGCVCKGNDVLFLVSQTCPGLSKLVFLARLDDFNEELKIEFPQHYFTLIKLNVIGIRHYKVENQRQVTWYKLIEKSIIRLFSFQDKQNIALTQKDYNEPHVSVVYRGTTSIQIGGMVIPN